MLRTQSREPLSRRGGKTSQRIPNSRGTASKRLQGVIPVSRGAGRAGGAFACRERSRSGRQPGCSFTENSWFCSFTVRLSLRSTTTVSITIFLYFFFFFSPPSLDAACPPSPFTKAARGFSCESYRNGKDGADGRPFPCSLFHPQSCRAKSRVSRHAPTLPRGYRCSGSGGRGGHPRGRPLPPNPR